MDFMKHLYVKAQRVTVLFMLGYALISGWILFLAVKGAVMGTASILGVIFFSVMGLYFVEQTRRKIKQAIELRKSYRQMKGAFEQMQQAIEKGLMDLFTGMNLPPNVEMKSFSSREEMEEYMASKGITPDQVTTCESMEEVQEKLMKVKEKMTEPKE